MLFGGIAILITLRLVLHIAASFLLPLFILLLASTFALAFGSRMFFRR
jgi:hypothetical protein